jgi:limonene-1,2-epoxide hydrolase
VVGIMEFDGAFISLWREYYDRQQLLRARGEKVD